MLMHDFFFFRNENDVSRNKTKLITSQMKSFSKERKKTEQERVSKSADGMRRLSK